MRRLYPVLKWVWGPIIVSGVVASLLTGCLIDFVQGKGCTQGQSVLSFLTSPSGPLLYLPLLGLGVLSLMVLWDHRRHKARERVREIRERDHEARERAHKRLGLLKSVNELRPEALNFRALKPGEHPTQSERPFYESVYVPRQAIPYERRDDEDPQPRYSEEALVRSLQENKGFVLLGSPLDGKTRTLYEVVKRMDGYQVIRPDPHNVVPEDEDFSLLLEGQEKVILLLDDLTRYGGGNMDLQEFSARLRSHTSAWTVASTCRDGPELETVKEAIEKGVKRFYDDISLKLTLWQASSEQKEWLAERIGRAWDEDAKRLPNLGHIVMEEPMRYMKGRFGDLEPVQRDILRSLKLLAHAGVLPYTRKRLEAVLEHEDLFDRRGLYLRDHLDLLAERSFLRPGSHDPIEPEAAYLRYVVTYTSGKDPDDDLARLATVLEQIRDQQGLFYLGMTYISLNEDYEQAKGCFDRVIELSPDLSLAWNARAAALENLGRHEEALEAHDEAIRLEPDLPEGWFGKGMALVNLGRYEEAVEWLCKVWQVSERIPYERVTAAAETLRRLGHNPEECQEGYSSTLDLP